MVFFPSYDYERRVHSHWEESGVLEKIGKKKRVSHVTLNNGCSVCVCVCVCVRVCVCVKLIVVYVYLGVQRAKALLSSRLCSLTIQQVH